MLLPAGKAKTQGRNRSHYERQRDEPGSAHNLYLLRLRLGVKGNKLGKQIGVFIEILQIANC
jgi:hypothetical protein